MDEAHPTLEATALLASWRDAGLTDGQETAVIGAWLAADGAADDPPLLVKILSAVGTAFATAFFLAFLGASRLIDFSSASALFGWGVAFLGLGIAAALALRGATPGVGRELLGQSGFVTLAIGKVLVVVAVGTGLHPLPAGAITAALLALTVLTYPVSGSSLDRLLSPCAVIASALFDVLELQVAGPATGWALTGLFAALTATTAALLLPKRTIPVLRPVGLAALAGMGTVVCILASGHDFALWAGNRPIDPRPIEAILTLALVGLIVWVARGGAEPAATDAGVRLEAVATAIAGVAVLGLAAAPGIVFAIGVMVLGHAHHDRALRAFGMLALPVFLVIWYYGRDMTFLMKSAALVGSGAALLVARAHLAWRGFDRRAAS